MARIEGVDLPREKRIETGLTYLYGGAKNNGMKGIGVLYGYGSRDELLQAGAEHVCATPGAILGCIP